MVIRRPRVCKYLGSISFCWTTCIRLFLTQAEMPQQALVRGAHDFGPKIIVSGARHHASAPFVHGLSVQGVVNGTRSACLMRTEPKLSSPTDSAFCCCPSIRGCDCPPCWPVISIVFAMVPTAFDTLIRDEAKYQEPQASGKRRCLPQTTPWRQSSCTVADFHRRSLSTMSCSIM